MFVLANPTPAVTANMNVMAQTPHTAQAVALCRVFQRRTAQDGTASASRSEATPIARKSHPATSLEPRDRAKNPFMVTPTPASATADIVSRNGVTGRDGVTVFVTFAGTEAFF